uniref:Retrotransposable element Tf2 n=1 Tax=Cajanus cajan TaxID=3821 RepID=A0A151UAN7_CAJCA|nr:Retrotransposable element Tf2 [Cajanus cajan]
MLRRLLSSQPSGTLSQRENIFHTRCNILNEACSLIVDSGSWCNCCSTRLVKKLSLITMPHPKPYHLQRLNKDGEIVVSQQVKVKLSIGKYEDQVLCDIVPLEGCHILLGRPWQIEKKTMHNGLTNEITFTHKEKKFVLYPLSPQQVAEDQAQMKIKRKEEKEKKKSFCLGKSKEEDVSYEGVVIKENCFITKNPTKNILFIPKDLNSLPLVATSLEEEIRKSNNFKEKESQLQDLVKKKWNSISLTSYATSLVVPKVASPPLFRTPPTLVVLIKHPILVIYYLFDTTYEPSRLLLTYPFHNYPTNNILQNCLGNFLVVFALFSRKCLGYHIEYFRIKSIGCYSLSFSTFLGFSNISRHCLGEDPIHYSRRPSVIKFFIRFFSNSLFQESSKSWRIILSLRTPQRNSSFMLSSSSFFLFKEEPNHLKCFSSLGAWIFVSTIGVWIHQEKKGNLKMESEEVRQPLLLLHSIIDGVLSQAFFLLLYCLGLSVTSNQPSLLGHKGKSEFLRQVGLKQLQDVELVKLLGLLGTEKAVGFEMGEDGILRFKGKIFLPQDAELRRAVLEEGHRSRLSIHQGMTKMYQDLKKTFWWYGMKREIVEYVAACLTYQKAKVEYQKPSGLMQQMEIPEWKWDSITMDFIVGFPRSARNSDVIWVILDRLTKCAHFLPVNIKWSLEKLTQLYVREIVRLHGVPSSIISDRDSRFTSKFWQSLHQALGTKLKLSSAYHPQTDGQSEKTIQSLEDLLRACVLDHLGSWEEVLPLVEFTYNNSFHASIGMTSFEVLYGRRCRTPLCWYQDGESVVVGPELILQTTEKVKLI